MHVLIIDDEAAVRQILSSIVTRAGHTVDTASNVKEAASRLVRGDVDLALCDIRMPDGDGVDLVRSFRGTCIDTQFIMVTAFASMETAVEALRAGASDYMVKPIRAEELTHRLAQAEAVRGLQAENTALRKLVVGDNASNTFRFSSEKMAQVEKLVRKVAVTDSTVLITGESGTGKGVIARTIHASSLRAEAPFLPVNCAAIPENLLESELFGHTKGAFSGADKSRKGLFVAADHGTLFLDEIGELPPHMQTKLLHVIEEKEVRPIGSEQARHVNVRILAATNRDLQAMVKVGRFREDLYFRLSQFHIHIPPLRERREEIVALIRYFIEKLTGPDNLEVVLDPEAEEILANYAWPGNVRELDNVINRAYIISDGKTILPDDLPPDLMAPKHTLTHDTGVQRNVGELSTGGLKEQLRRVEADIIAQALHEAGGDRRLAAQKLEIGVSSLYRKIEELSLDNNAMEVTRS